MTTNVQKIMTQRKAAEKAAYAKYKQAAEAAWDHSVANEGEPDQHLELKKQSLGRDWIQRREDIRDFRVLVKNPAQANYYNTQQ